MTRTSSTAATHSPKHSPNGSSEQRGRCHPGSLVTRLPMSSRPRKARKLARSREEENAIGEIAVAARRAHALHNERHGGSTDESLGMLLAHLEKGTYDVEAQAARRAEFEPVPAAEFPFERASAMCLERLQTGRHGKAMLKALKALSPVDSDEAHWNGPFGAKLRSLVEGRDKPNPNIRVMRAVNASLNPVALLTPPGEPALAAVAARHIAAGTPVALYTGELVADGDADLPSSTYVYEIARDELGARKYPAKLPSLRIDASRRGGEARFVNDKWAPAGWPQRIPNVYIDTVYDGASRELHLCFFASTPILKGCEIIADYGPDYWQTALRLLLAAHRQVASDLEAQLGKGGEEAESGEEGDDNEGEAEEESEEEESEEEEGEEEEDGEEEEGEEEDDDDDSAELTDPALEELRTRLSDGGLDIILFDDLPEPEPEGAPAADLLTRLLPLEHLLLPIGIVRRAEAVADELRAMCGEWDGEESALSDALVESVLIPNVCEASKDARAARWQPALGTLLGLLLFCSVEDSWLLDNECHQEWASWRGLFENLSSAWRDVLAQDDATLGLRPKKGRREGYRPKLLALLREWQDETNVALSGYDEPNYEPVRVSAWVG